MARLSAGGHGAFVQRLTRIRAPGLQRAISRPLRHAGARINVRECIEAAYFEVGFFPPDRSLPSGRLTTARHSARGRVAPAPVAIRSRTPETEIASVQYEKGSAWIQVTKNARSSRREIRRSAAAGSVE